MPERCTKLEFVGPLTLRTASETCGALREALAHHSAVAIDCEAATDIDLSFIQLLVAARNSAKQASKTVCLAGGRHGVLLAALSRAGLRSANLGHTDTAGDLWFEEA